MPNRKYDPPLIWGYLSRWAEMNFTDRLPNDRLQVFFYVKDKGGAYYMNGPKLYWDETIGDGYFGNTDQNSLEQNAKNLREVVISGVKRSRESVMFPTYEDFLVEVGYTE